MRNLLLTMAVAVLLGITGCSILKGITGQDIADFIDLILDEETDQTVLVDSLANLVGDGVVDVTSAPEFVSDVFTQTDTSSTVVIVTGDSPVAVVDAQTDSTSVVDVDPATEYTLSFISASIRERSFKISVVISGVEDVGPFTSFKWDSTVPDSLHFDGISPGTDGVTNGWAGIATNANDQHWKYGRVGGYSSSLAPGNKSGVLVDMFYSGPIKFAEDVIYFDLAFGYGSNIRPVASNPQIDIHRRLIEPTG